MCSIHVCIYTRRKLLVCILNINKSTAVGGSFRSNVITCTQLSPHSVRRTSCLWAIYNNPKRKYYFTKLVPGKSLCIYVRTPSGALSVCRTLICFKRILWFCLIEYDSILYLFFFYIPIEYCDSFLLDELL